MLVGMAAETHMVCGATMRIKTIADARANNQPPADAGGGAVL